MAFISHIYDRKTFRYVDSYRHLDQEVYVCAQKFPAPKIVKVGNEYDDGVTIVYTLRAPVNVPKDYARILSRALSYSGCSHDYDCCGCGSRYARAERINRRTFRVTIKTYYNY